MNKGRTIIMKNNTTNTGIAVAERPAGQAQVRFIAPAAFRAQERFWSEVKRHIVERRPNAAKKQDRLY